MMRGTHAAKATALIVAVSLHGAVALSLAPKEDVQAEGAAGDIEVRLGNAFADMVAGTLATVAPDRTEAQTPQRAHAEKATPAQPAETVAATEAARPDPTARSETVSTTEPVKPEHATTAAPDTLAQLAPSETIETLQTPDRVESSAPENTAVARSMRPIQRSASFEATHRPTPIARASPTSNPTTLPPPQAAPTPGNAERDARAGEATGQTDAPAQQSGTGQRQQAAGNAAASNYPGLVMRTLSRAGKPRINARGSAVVAFTISENGALSSVSLAQSSGSSALDQAALRLVRGAGPFPRPPRTAQRSFSIEVQGR